MEPVYGALWRRFHFSFGVFSVVRFVLAGSLLLGPTVLMGATLPVLSEYLAGQRGRGLPPQWLYTANLAGAVLGVALAGFVLMPALGLWGTILVGAALNLAVGIGVFAMPAPRATPSPSTQVANTPELRPGTLFLGTALASGFAASAPP